MNVEVYKNKVIDLFKNGSPTNKQWEEMAECVLIQSESNDYTTQEIDNLVDPNIKETD